MNKDVSVENLNIGVVGAGSWGTALANLLAGKGYKISLWSYEEDVCSQINDESENKTFLPGARLSGNLTASNDLERVVSGKNIVVLVVPSHVMRETAEKIAGFISDTTILVTASKGIENETFLTMTGVLKDVLPDIPEKNFSVLSGPSFAKELARGLPTVVTVASSDLETAKLVQAVFATDRFRVYSSTDVIGVELGGAVKNVIAIAAGVSDGLEMGLNTRAALITRGLVEIKRIGMKLGANPHTFSGLAGIGDLMLTCTGSLSRNHTVGEKIGRGMTLEEILKEMRMVAEGVKTAKSVYNMSKKLGIELPICEAVYRTLYEGLSPEDAGHALMTRTLKHELYDMMQDES